MIRQNESRLLRKDGTAALVHRAAAPSPKRGMFVPEKGPTFLKVYVIPVLLLNLATARKLAVPDLATTVLTLTIVGIAADTRLAGGSGSRADRRLISVGAMFVDALVGSLLIFHVSIVFPLVIALIVLAVIAGATRLLSRTDPDWVHAS